jgi:SAM-dependent methyltransferase
MDPRERFTATVDQYTRFRPSYPEAFLAWLDATAPGSRAVDLGSGTGILSRQLVRRGFTVVGVEPNAAMRAAAEREGGATYVDGTAERTGLPDASADLVIGGQAFHWFDLDLCLPEIDRVLARGGLSVAVWNDRVPEGFARAYDEVLLRFSSSYAAVPRPAPTLAALAARRPQGSAVSFPHAQRLDLDGLIGRAWSSSYVVHGVEDRAAFDDALRATFDAHAADATVELRYETAVFYWTRE